MNVIRLIGLLVIRASLKGGSVTFGPEVKWQACELKRVWFFILALIDSKEQMQTFPNRYLIAMIS